MSGLQSRNVVQRYVILPLVVVTALAAAGNCARAQVHSDSVHDGLGTLSNLSTNAGAGSGPVHERGRSVRESSLYRLGGNPVRGSVTGDLGSGPVSELTVGTATSSQPVSGGGTMTDASAGAVKKDITSPLGQLISEPLTELGALQEQLRAIQPVPRQTPMASERLAGEEAAAQAAAEQAAAEQAAAALNELETPEPPPAAEQPPAESAEEPLANEPEPQAPVVEPEAPMAEATDEGSSPEPVNAAAPEPEIKAEAELEGAAPPVSEAEEPRQGEETPDVPGAEP